MFRRKSTSLPADPVYPANLKELGYEITSKGQFVKIGTNEKFQFFITDNDRYNEVHKEAMHGEWS